MSSMPRTKLTPDERRRIILEALRGANKRQLALRYDIARSWLYALLDEVRENPEGKLRDAEAEADFRRKVVELLRSL
jgi:transposase-like protein